MQRLGSRSLHQHHDAPDVGPLGHNDYIERTHYL
ncbi:hypothetical protein BN12_990001 [Nostocoides japonicum T1-X7]|uniref:Uncharacterized protein n=1 Tax=Nostocoides japonicum T1-X7 TaxID=1194083 RepID=A0A077M943_9MICO|nr:hypothetical protein BN12_990001 [Tetrasphaera japonica T1-X7]